MEDYMTLQEAANSWGLTKRRINTLCNQGRIDGARKFGNTWVLPADTGKPVDLRIKSGRYKKDRQI